MPQVERINRKLEISRPIQEEFIKKFDGPLRAISIDDIRNGGREKETKRRDPYVTRVSSYWRDRVTRGSRHRVSIPRILSSGFHRRTKEIGQIIGSSDTQVGAEPFEPWEPCARTIVRGTLDTFGSSGSTPGRKKFGKRDISRFISTKPRSRHTFSLLRTNIGKTLKVSSRVRVLSSNWQIYRQRYIGCSARE